MSNFQIPQSQFASIAPRKLYGNKQESSFYWVIQLDPTQNSAQEMVGYSMLNNHRENEDKVYVLCQKLTMLFTKGYVFRCLRIDFYSVLNPDITPFLTISPQGFNGSEKIMKHPIIHSVLNKLFDTHVRCVEAKQNPNFEAVLYAQFPDKQTRGKKYKEELANVKLPRNYNFFKNYEHLCEYMLTLSKSNTVPQERIDGYFKDCVKVRFPSYDGTNFNNKIAEVPQPVVTPTHEEARQAKEARIERQQRTREEFEAKKRQIYGIK